MKNFYVTLALSAIASYGYCQESCETAIELPVTDSNVTVPEVPSTDGSRYSVWFSFQAPAENDVVLQLKPVGYDSYVMWEG